MKITRRSISNLILLVFTVLINSIAYSQCALTNLSITESVCDASEKVDLIIDFDYSEEGNQGFTILGNGINYGNFQYSSLPITLSGIDANCDTEYEFIIRDIMDPTCSVFTEYGIICCENGCNLNLSEVVVSDCADGLFSLSINVNPESIGTLVDVYIGESFISQIELDGMFFLLEDISLAEGGIHEVSICRATDTDCCSSATFINPCKCSITSITTEIVDCNILDSSYYVIFDFDHVANVDSFQMGYSESGINNFLGVFSYNDLPVTAGPIFMSDDEREILIVDKGDFFCFEPAFLGVVNDCDINCQIFNVFAESYACENGQYFMDIELDTEDIEGNSFEVIVDGVNYGTYEYGDNIYTVGPINQNCDTAPVLVIQDSNVDLCKDFYNFSDPICCSVECEFTTFEATAICNDNNEAVITLEYNNPSTTPNNQFFVTLNDLEFGPYNGPSGMESIIVPTLADGVYTMMIFVDGNSECSAVTEFEYECIVPECEILNVFAEVHECIDGTFLVDIEFDGSAVSDSFEIRGNGQTYGTFSYGQSFYTVGPLEGDCETIYEFVVIDQADSDCQNVFEFEEPICCTICSYGDLDIGIIDCIDDEYIITIDFEYEDSGDNFTVTYLGETFPYSYDQLPIEISGLPVNTEIEILVVSSNDEGCNTSTVVFQESCLDAITEAELNTMKLIQSEHDITIYNPTEYQFDLAITSTSGQILHKGNLVAYSEYSVDKVNIPNGIYFISYITNNQIISRKIVILNSIK